MLHHEQHLEQPNDSGRRVEMADVALDGADAASLWPGLVGGECLRETSDFGGVAQRGCSAVRFDVAHTLGAHASVAPRLADERGLGAGVGSRKTVGGTVLVHGNPADDAVDVVTVIEGLTGALQN